MCGQCVDCDMHVESTLPPVRSLELMPTGSTGSKKKKNLTGLNVMDRFNHSFSRGYFVLGGLPLSKCFLWLIPRWICEFEKHSIWLCFKHAKMQRKGHFRVLMFVSICCCSPGTKARKTCDSSCSNTTTLKSHKIFGSVFEY